MAITAKSKKNPAAVALGRLGGWFLAHRYGRLRGFVDANKNGVDDRVEMKTGN